MNSFPLTTGYAIEALACLARAGGGSMRVSEISELTGVPFHYLSKIFQRLGDAGITESKRGHKGGVRLLRPPGEITILEIDAALESARPGANIAADDSRPHTFWEAFHLSYREKLATMTLEEVIAYQTRPVAS